MLRGPLMHSIRRVHRQPVLGRPRQNRPEVTGHALEYALLRKRRIFAIRAAPQARVVELGDDGPVLRVDHERGPGVPVAFEVIVDIRSYEALWPGQAVELQAGCTPHTAAC